MERSEQAPVTVRSATVDDLAAITTMVWALNAHHEDTTEPAAVDLRHLLFEQAHGTASYLAEAAGQPIGYAVVQPYLHLHFGAWGGEVHHLFVDAAWRGQGVGRMLVAKAARDLEASGARYVRIKTDPDNVAAQDAYIAMGFTRRAPGPIFTMQIGSEA